MFTEHRENHTVSERKEISFVDLMSTTGEIILSEDRELIIQYNTQIPTFGLAKAFETQIPSLWYEGLEKKYCLKIQDRSLFKKHGFFHLTIKSIVPSSINEKMSDDAVSIRFVDDNDEIENWIPKEYPLPSKDNTFIDALFEYQIRTSIKHGNVTPNIMTVVQDWKFTNAIKRAAEEHSVKFIDIFYQDFMVSFLTNRYSEKMSERLTKVFQHFFKKEKAFLYCPSLK